MIYTCPSCGYGRLRSIRSVYTRRWGDAFVTVPNFPAWRCDHCGYTRYDAAALAQIELVLGPDEDDLAEQGVLPRMSEGNGPGERGPRRWSF